MVGMRRKDGRSRRGPFRNTAEAVAYRTKVLNLSPLAYWPCDETSGTTADNLEGTAARDGLYTGVSVNATTWLDSTAAPQWDGTNDDLDIYSASLDGVFDGAEGSWAGWVKVSGAGVWTNGASDRILTFGVDGSNYYILQKATSNNAISWIRNAGGTGSQRDKTSVSTTDWFHMGFTWSETTDECKAYYDGVQEGATLTGLGTWAGSLLSTLCVIGAEDNTANKTWDGYLAHWAVFDTVLSAGDMASLATAP